MSSVVSNMTTPEMLSLPDDGLERELIRGHLREREMTRRNRLLAATESRIVGQLFLWLQNTPSFSAHILSGEAGTILAENPDTTVGIDVALFSSQIMDNQP